MTSRLTQLEEDVIGAILRSTQKDIRECLIRQYEGLKVKKRTFTNVGFFTEFYDCEDVLSCEGVESLRLGGIHAKVLGLKYGAGFVLSIKRGRITLLEGYCHDEVWPPDAKAVAFFKIQENGSLIQI